MRIFKIIKIIIFFEIISFVGLVSVYYFNKLQTSQQNQNNTVSAPVYQPTSYPNPVPFSSSEAPKPVDKTVKLLMLGDTGLLEPLGSHVVNDPNFDPLANVEAFFKKFNYVVATLETTIDGVSVGAPNPGKAFTESTPTQSAEVFAKAGISAFSYAGNHAKDFGPASVNHTIDLLHAAGVGVFGAGANNDAAYTPLIVDLVYAKVAFLGFDCIEYDFNHATDTEAGTASFSEGRVRAAIAKAHEEADVVVVFAHWGEEHTLELDPVWQVQWANIFTNAGADIVIGGHPHIIQQQDVVNGKPVFYSIGNFMYPGQNGYGGGATGDAVEIDIADKAISGVKVHTSTMDNDGIPTITE